MTSYNNESNQERVRRALAAGREVNLARKYPMEPTDLFGYLPDDDPKLKKAFLEFHSENPGIYDMFKQYTFQAIRSGRQNFSARAIFHRIRWFTNVETRSDDEFKLNNNHSPFYVRMFNREYPQYRGFFRTRNSVADD